MKKCYLTTIITITICFFTACSNFGEDLCSNREIKSLPSPNGKNKAVIFERDCGATSGFNTQISILAATDKLPNDGSNTFVADNNHEYALSGMENGPLINLKWDNDKELVIIYDKRARVFLSEQLVNGVNIRYEPK